MPIYVYRCENDHEFEVLQRMTDDPVTTCEICGASVQRVFQPVAVHFKGKGFYTTDYGKGAAATSSTDGKPESDSGADSTSTKPEDKKSDSKDSKKKESSTKSAAKD